MTIISEELKVALLVAAYKKMVSDRNAGKPCYIKVNRDLARDVAKGLDFRLVKVFIEAQFKAMPPDFCMRTFKRNYPPFNVVCGGNCWTRYEDYMQRGVRDGQ